MSSSEYHIYPTEQVQSSSYAGIQDILELEELIQTPVSTTYDDAPDGDEVVLQSEKEKADAYPLKPAGSLLAQGLMSLRSFMNPDRLQAESFLSNSVSRNLLLQVLPVAVVLVWCSVPLPLYQQPVGTYRIQFWFFLLFYYGIYNAVGLLWITKIFRLYSVSWWPSQLSAIASYLLFWIASLLLGSLAVYFSSMSQVTFTWILLMFMSMIVPIGLSFTKLWKKHTRQTTQLLAQLSLLDPNVRDNAIFETVGWRDAYAHYSWFIVVICISLLVYLAGEYLTNVYHSTLPHSSTVAVAYVYSWTLTVSSCNLITSWILNTKSHSYALVSVFKLYFELTLQVYVRNMYARLESPQQFVMVQATSSFVMMNIMPLVFMSKTAYRLNVALTKTTDTYPMYRKNMGRNFYVKCLAANISLMAFLGWSLILHFGPNSPVYPYFSFPANEPYRFNLTFFASLAVWLHENVAAMITRWLMRRMFHFETTLEAIKDFIEYPDLIMAMVAVSVHVLQNVLFSIVHLKF